MKRILGALVMTTLLAAGSAKGDATIVLSACRLQDENGAAMPTNGLILLVADTGQNGFPTNFLHPATPLSVGSYLYQGFTQTDDLILGAFDLASLGKAGQFLNVYAVVTNSPTAPGLPLGLYWFPSLTTTSTYPGSGRRFGFYTDQTGIDRSAPWWIPPVTGGIGNVVQFNFYTSNCGGSNPNSTGRSSHVIEYGEFTAWQYQYFGNPTNSLAGPDIDADGDGFTNWQEFFTKTDPTNSVSAFHIVSVERTNDDALIAWQTGGGRTNVVQALTDIAGVYSNLSSNIVTTGGADVTTNYLDAGGATNAANRFYRILLVP